jgi:hypothetical protein
MACPFPDCQAPAKIEVRYAAREIECSSCGKFKMSEGLFDAAAGIFAVEPDALADLREFIQARNSEGKTPLLTDENWQILAAERRHSGSL